MILYFVSFGFNFACGDELDHISMWGPDCKDLSEGVLS